MVASFAPQADEATTVMRSSQRLWGLDWARYLPWQFDGATVEAVSFGEALPFMATHYPSIFHATENAGRFLDDPMTPAKRRFCDQMDVLALRRDGETIGLWMAHPTDWSTYYVRSTAILPQYRGLNYGPTLMQHTYGPLRDAGVDRVECEASPTNAICVKALLDMGFVVTATANSERWGAILRLTKFLGDGAEKTYMRQFCAHYSQSAPRRGRGFQEPIERRIP